MLKEIENHLLNKDRCPICNEKLNFADISDFNITSDSSVKKYTSCNEHFVVMLSINADDNEYHYLDVDQSIELKDKENNIVYGIHDNSSFAIEKKFFSLEGGRLIFDIKLHFLPSYQYGENVVIYGSRKQCVDLDLSKIKFPMSEKTLISKIKTLQIYQ